MKYANAEDISVAIQCLKVITEKRGLDEKTKMKINPKLLRVIMELEEIARKD